MTVATGVSNQLGECPTEVAEALETEIGEMESRFSRRDWHPLKLHAGRFAEAVLRYLEWKCSGSFTPIGQTASRSRILAAAERDTSLPEGLRFQVVGCVNLLLDTRNKRNVAHLGKIVDMEVADAQLVIVASAWTLAEIVRIESGLPLYEVQRLVDTLSIKRVALVEEVAGDLIVLATDLPARERALTALYHAYPQPIAMDVLRTSVQYQNSTNFRRLLGKEQAKALVHLKDGFVYLTQKGIAWVEENISFDLMLD